MKSYFTPVLLLLSLAVSAQPKKIDRSANNLYGPVKSTTTVYFTAEEKFGELTKEAKRLTETDEYNKEGLLIFSKVDFRGSVTKTSYKYDSKRNLIEQKETDEEDEKLIQITYDAGGKETEVNTYNKKGSLETKLKKKYDEQGLLTVANLYNGDGTLRERETFTYNAKKLIEEKKLADGKGKTIRTTTYWYNDKGRITGERTYSLDTDNTTVVMTLTDLAYDQHDRLILKSILRPDRSKREETTLEYDQFGNVTNDFTSAIMYTKDKYSYDKQNNWTLSHREWNSSGTKRRYIIERTVKYY